MEDPTKDIAVSVPHSGTRSLCKYLWPNDEQFNYLHWGQNDADIAQLSGTVHVPIREPLDLALSWDARYPTEQGDKTPESMLWRMDRMLEFIGSYDKVKLWKIEDLPLFDASKGPDHGKMDTPRIHALRRWMRDNSGFYREWYDLAWL